MNTAAIYRDAVDVKRRDETALNEQQAETEKILANHNDKLAREVWLQHAVTVKVLGGLHKQIKALQAANENLTSVSFEDNKETILKNTTRITELKKVLNYAQSGSYSVA